MALRGRESLRVDDHVTSIFKLEALGVGL